MEKQQTLNNTKPKLGIIGSVGAPAKYGGFETLTHHLVLNLNERFDMTVYCSKYAYEENERLPSWNGAKLVYLPFQANGLQSIIYDLVSIVHAVKHCDRLLILGVSACMFLPFIKLFTKKKIVVNIDGLEWRRPKWNWFAKKFLLFSETVACKFADEIVTDNRILKEYVKIRYGINGNLVEYGADHVHKVAVMEKDMVQYPFLAGDYAFKVARIEPENHLHVILEAFAQTPQEIITIVGNWDNSAYGKNLKKTYQKYKNIYLIDPIYDAKHLDLLRSNAKYYLHGHSAGGTNPSLVEAMYLALPILSYDVIYNRVTTNNQAIYFNSVKDLKQILVNIDKQPLRTVASIMKAYAEKRYTWANIAWRYGNIMEGIERLRTASLWLEQVATTQLAEKALEKSQSELQKAMPVHIEELEAADYLRA